MPGIGATDRMWRYADVPAINQPLPLNFFRCEKSASGVPTPEAFFVGKTLKSKFSISCKFRLRHYLSAALRGGDSILIIVFGETKSEVQPPL